MKPGIFAIDDGRVGARAFLDVLALRGSKDHRDHVVEATVLRCGRAALKQLHDHGYPSDLYVLLNTAQITVSDSDDDTRPGTYVTLRYPHDGHRHPDELTPERGVDVELYGGPLDGTVHTVKINDGGFLICIPPSPIEELMNEPAPALAADDRVIYRRAGIDPATGRFLYTPTGR